MEAMSFYPSENRFGPHHFTGVPLISIQGQAGDYLSQPTFQGVIDPNLVQSGDTQVQPILRYLHEQQGQPFVRRVAYVQLPFPSILSQHQAQEKSPSSQPQLSASSSSQSPRTESDMLHDSSYDPFTPSDMTSPYVSSMGDALDRQSDLARLNPSYTDQYIDPAIILGSQTPAPGYYDMHSTEEQSLYSGDSLNAFLAPFPTQSNEAADSTIHVPTTASQYPDIEEVDEISTQGECTDLISSEEEEGDPDYRPDLSASSRRGFRGRPRGSRAARNGVTKSYRGKSSLTPLKPRPLESFICPQCPDTLFDGASALKKHNKLEHKRAFPCIFQFAGCPDGFSNKNEWKRHVSTQHLNTYFWLCTNGSCRKTMKRNGKVYLTGRSFKRKDLFTQHVRRMHTPLDPSDFPKSSKNQSSGPDAELISMQEGARHKRCPMPEFLHCNVRECSMEFTGDKAWDEHMEHLAADHVEAATRGLCDPVDFIRDLNKSLIDWASSTGVNVIRRTMTGWELCDPLKNISVEVKEVSSNTCR
ncbi:hypothetical protein BGZ63DRAFT_403663 [Mariannaea sp. PMI_226]|nr:hypothetical protein BGZ63DRAFT_403663 [Mariannaea sp. PMI_226]